MLPNTASTCSGRTVREGGGRAVVTCVPQSLLLFAPNPGVAETEIVSRRDRKSWDALFVPLFYLL